jgi:DNA-binding NarL/FixJ family response regulator
MGELQRLSPPLWGLAEVALLAGDPRRAVDLAEEAVAASEAVRDAAYLFPFVVTGVRAALASGDPAAARRWLDRLAPIVTERAIPGTAAAIEHAAGLVALADGRTGQARTALTAVIDAWAARARVWEATWARIDLARAHQRANQATDAARVASAAAAAARELGSPPLEAAANEILGAVRRGRPDDPWAPLTAREYEVARLIAEGRTNGEVATELSLSPKTISAHVEHILAKLGMSRRTEIGGWIATIPVLHSAPHGGDREE